MSSSDRTAALRARRTQQQNAPAGRQPAPRHTTGRPADLVITSDMIPAPVPVEASGDLNHEEIHQLGLCEQAVANLSTATWLAGKAMQSIRDRKLYRQTHTRFDAYIQERWEISERTAYQMIEEWPLAESLATKMGEPVTASHTRALIHVSHLFGLDAAADLYQQLHTRAADEELRLTATIISQITKAIIATTGKKAEAADFRATARQLVTAKALPLTAAPAQPRRTLTTGSSGQAPAPVSTPPSASASAPTQEPTSLRNFADNHGTVTTPDPGPQPATGPQLPSPIALAPDQAGTEADSGGTYVLALIERIAALAAALDKEVAPLDDLDAINWAQSSHAQRALELRDEAVADLSSSILTLKRAMPFNQTR
ncbi:hypothetical protein [Actinacidiphila oryziradicis]|uniref:Uncharacterized protein n=1 Tax=Actinacidiphila oryziradicis TaxID=2571141 RepID=A0A4U0RS90_9ACTN|nr:hypothetical protein [Actinacidiphila oryziradicis]TJZ98262.1 hypothetical protein FCI23_48580 [Actinacidiphila oryziradicis]